MDERIRKLLRDRDSTPEACYTALARVGMSPPEIFQALVAAGKVADDYDIWVNLQFRLRLINLIQARKEVADHAFEEYDFGGVVEGVNGWEVSGTTWRRVVFVLPEGAEVTEAVHFRVDFVERSPVVVFIGLMW